MADTSTGPKVVVVQASQLNGGWDPRVHIRAKELGLDVSTTDRFQRLRQFMELEAGITKDVALVRSLEERIQTYEQKCHQLLSHLVGEPDGETQN